MIETLPTLTPTKTRFRVLSLLVALASLTYLDRLCIAAAAPAIIQEFHFSPSQMGYIFSAFTLSYALFEIPSGWLGDYLGTRKALTRIVLWWSAFTMLTGATVGFTSLLIVRLLFGAGEAGAVPNSAGTVSRWFPASQQGRAMCMVFIGHAIGATITAPLVFQLVAWQGWRLTFVEFGAVGAIWCLVWYWWFRDVPEEHTSVNAAELNLIRSDHSHIGQHAHTHGVPWMTLLKSKNLLFICAMYFAYGYSLYFYITWLPTYLLKARGFSPAYAGFFSSLPWLLSIGAFLIGGWATDWLANRIGNRKLGRCGVGAFGLTMSALMLIIVARTENRMVAATLIAFALCFQLMTAPAAWAVCLDIGRRIAGVVTGCMNTSGNLAGTIAPIAIGYILEGTGSWTIPFYVAASILMCGSIMWLFVNPQQKLLKEEIIH